MMNQARGYGGELCIGNVCSSGNSTVTVGQAAGSWPVVMLNNRYRARHYADASREALARYDCKR